MSQDEKVLGIPSVVIYADYMDAWNFSAAQFQARADAFVDLLVEKKGSNQQEALK
jgi:hypothetical protein